MNGVQALVGGIADAAFATEPGGRVVAWNAGAERLLGIPAASAVGEPCAALIHGRNREGITVCTSPCPLLEAMDHAGCSCVPAAAEMVPAHPDMSVRRGDGGRVEVRVVAVPVVVGGAPALLHVLREQRDTDVDPLSGCLRRWSFEPRAVALQDHAAARAEPLAAALVRIDRLAVISTEHGLAAGDRVVAAVGTYLRYGRRDDAVCRWGAAEFALLLPAMTAAQAAERLRVTRDTVREHVRVNGQGLTLSGAVTAADPSSALKRTMHRVEEILSRTPAGSILSG